MKNGLRYIQEETSKIKQAGLYKDERILTTPQNTKISTTTSEKVINMCANNYLGLSNNSTIINAAIDSYKNWGYGLSSVRFICGTQEIHKKLEQSISRFLQTEDTILYSSCYDANGGLFETILTKDDAIISDELNHASIIDGVRLCKAQRFKYKNNCMEDLENNIKQAKDARIRLIATDGVFSMDGTIANLKEICALAEKYDCLVMVDDSHAVGFMGETGRGTHELCGCIEKVDIITGTLGKALGGASGGYTSGKKEIIELLRQKSRPYLFSNTLAPAITAGAIKTFEMLSSDNSICKKLHENTVYFRNNIKKIGLDIIDSTHPIVAIMLYDAALATTFASKMLEKNVYVIGFSFPVVPMGKARIRVQISAGHTIEELDYVIKCFGEIAKEMDIIK